MIYKSATANAEIRFRTGDECITKNALRFLTKFKTEKWFQRSIYIYSEKPELEKECLALATMSSFGKTDFTIVITTDKQVIEKFDNYKSALDYLYDEISEIKG